MSISSETTGAKPTKCKRCGTENTKWRKDSTRKQGGSFRCITCTNNINTKFRRSHPLPCLLERLKIRARNRGFSFDLTLEDIVIPKHCPVLGIKLLPLGTGTHTTSDNSPSVDRIDNNKGYTKDNIIVISNRANKIKRDASLEELNLIVNFYNKLVPSR